MPVLGEESLRAIRDYINKSNLIKVTYDSLVELRNNSKLKSGTFYQITDYCTTTIQENTKSAGHVFDVIVLATSNDCLSENAFVTYHINNDGTSDGYFAETVKGKLESAEWISPMPSISDIEILYNINSDESLYVENVHDTAKIITELSTIENQDGIEVPAMLNPDPDDNNEECWYVYCGTFDINKWTNNLISVSYEMYTDSEEIVYEGDSTINDKDLLCDIATVNGVPTLYKTDIEVYDPLTEVDYDDEFRYVGNYELDGVTYNKWDKYQVDEGDPTGPKIPSGYSLLTNIIVVDNQFIVTPEEFRENIVEETTTYDKWQEYYPNGKTDGTYWADYYHLTDHFVDATFKSGLNKKANLDSWEIKYSLDNEEERFAWATNHVAIKVYDDRGSATYIYIRYPEGDINNKIAWAFISVSNDLNFSDIGDWTNIDTSDLLLTDTKYPSIGDILDMSGTDVEVVETLYPRGVIYFMKDEWNNECPYDFKNIQFRRYIIDTCEKVPALEGKYLGIKNGRGYIIDEGDFIWNYTFTWVNENGEVEDCSIVGQTFLNDEDQYSGVFNNKIASVSAYEMIYSQEPESFQFALNNIVIQATWSYEEGYFYGIYGNTFGNKCHSNTFGTRCNYNTFGYNCINNIFANNCSSNTFGNDCGNNIFGNDCPSNIFGRGCSYNTFGNDCYSNRFEYGFYSNIFGNGCSKNTFGSVCSSNIFGNACSSNIFGNDCSYNTFGDSSSTINYCKNIIIDNSCSYLYINSTDTSASSYSNQLQNIHIHLGVKGTSATNRKTITVDRGLDYETNIVPQGTTTVEV